MAISQFVEPDINLFFDDLEQAERLNNKASLYGKGYINIGLSNINSTPAPVLLEGSLFECGGVLFECGDVLFVSDTDTSIPGTPSNGQNYIYFNPETKGLLYSTATPLWNTVKGGWYNGNNRAIAKLFYTGGQYNGKVILDNYNAMKVVNAVQALPATGGVQVVDGASALNGVAMIDGASIAPGTNTVVSGANTSGKVYRVTLAPGAYRWEVRGGKGGNGGLSSSGGGGAGAEGQHNSGVFRLHSEKTIRYALGGDGTVGVVGVQGGGGGCTGGSAFIDLGDDLFLCIGGSGGGGSGDPGNDDYGGGGGGGGYGVAGDGLPAGTRQLQGYGGKNGIGGAGGSQDGTSDSLSGGGGSGYIAGGAGGFGDGNQGVPGGGYGLPGGTSSGQIPGGQSLSGEAPASATDKYPLRVQYQGGGAGAKNTGGGGLKPTSSGYLRIYRMW
jgi:hypothetical protein